MRALVTGGDGFVGRHLTEHLRAAGDEVTSIDRHGPGAVDIMDPVAIGAAMAAVRPDAVYHLAGWADVASSWQDPLGALRLNAEGTLHVLQACRAADVRRVLSVASADVYGTVGNADLPLTESSPIRPTSPYGASKVAADAMALQAFLGYGLGVIRVRPFNHLGPGQAEHFVAPALAARIARAERDGTTEIPVGNLTPRRDITDVRDVVRAYRLLVERGEPGEVYNVCSGIALAIQELADRLVALSTSDVVLRPDPALQRPVDLPVLLGSYAKLEAATGWRPTTPIEQTLADLLADLRTRVRADDPAPSEAT
jgi:GDP-4-dehydro-6-deoxy-D-mannose reductase